MANKYIIQGATYNGDGTTSAEAAGSTVTITIASPGVVTWTGHTLVANDPVYFTTTGALPTGLTAATKYYVRNPATNTFEVSATSGGASINTSGTQSGTHTARGVGAWNHVDIVAGTAVGIGSIAAGDVVYIRSKTGNGANGALTYTPSGATTFGSSAGTAASPVKWILDNGTTWSTIDGTFTISTSTASYTYTWLEYNEFHSLTKWNWIFENTASTYSFSFMLFRAVYTSGLKLNLPNSANNGWSINFASLVYGATHKDMYFYINTFSPTYACIAYELGTTILINPTIEVATAPSSLNGAIYGYAQSANLEVRGGRFTGSAISTGNLAVTQPQSYYGYQATATFIGFQVTKVAPLISQYPGHNSHVTFIGLDNGQGAALYRGWGSADCRNITNNYPTLNATLADSTNTPTSWRIYPKNVTKAILFDMPISKLYTDTAATKTLTLHFLATTSWAGSNTPDTSSVWMNVSYIDNSTGFTTIQSTRDIVGTSLTTSGLTWTPSNAWGAVSMTAYKLTLTTTGSIKKDTNITIDFMGSTGSGNANDIYILCPDVQLS